MTFRHGVFPSEVPTSVRPPITALAGLPIFVGASPIVHGVRTNVDVPVLCSSYAEFNTAFGDGARASYSLCQAAYIYFGLYGVGPAIFVNVLDPDDADHMEAVARAALAWTLAETSQTIEVFGIDHETVVLDDGSFAAVAYDLTDDYTLAYDDDGYTVVTRVATGAMGTGALPDCHLTYDKLDPTGVDAADIIGTTAAAGNTGLYCIEDCYPMLQYAPGIIACPGYSHEPTVMAAMVARGASINGGAFKAFAVCDLDPDSYEIANYSEAGAWKLANGYSSAALACCWPQVTSGTEVHWLSTHLIGLANQVDAGAGGGVPYVSPSNKALQIDGTCLEDETEVFLTQTQANVLNAAGIVTAMNFGGWRLWGNRTAAYPTSTDAKDVFIPIKRMTLWLHNTLVLSYFSQVDSALNRRLIDSVVDSVNIFLNGLKGQGAILGGECIFAEADNPTTELLDGHATFRIYWSPPPPAEAISFLIEYDPADLAALFG